MQHIPGSQDRGIRSADGAGLDHSVRPPGPPYGSTVLGVGTDLVDIERLRCVIERTPAITSRLFTDAEQAYAESSADPARPYAARFAAKEAVLKSLGLGLGAMRFAEIEVVRHESGRPELVLSGQASQLAERHGAAEFLVSLSHTHALASAFVVAVAA